MKREEVIRLAEELKLEERYTLYLADAAPYALVVQALHLMCDNAYQAGAKAEREERGLT